METMPSAGDILATILTFSGTATLLAAVIFATYNAVMKIKPLNDWYRKRQAEKYEIIFGKHVKGFESFVSQSLEAIKEEERLKKERIWSQLKELEEKLVDTKKEFEARLLDVEEELNIMQTSSAVQEEQIKNLSDNFDIRMTSLTEQIHKMCMELTVLTQHLIDK